MAEEVPVLRKALSTRPRRIAAGVAAALLVGAGLLWVLLPRRLTDEELFRLARGFRSAGLHREAAGAYDALIARSRPGRAPAAAYLEAADCRERLGHWSQARSLREVYLTIGSGTEAARAVEGRLATLVRVIRYQDLIAEEDLPDRKRAEALLDMGELVQGRLNAEAAAAIFAEAADRFPASARAAEARYSAGRALLGLGRLGEARGQFGRLVKDFPQGRLAGNAQFWIGHTYELEAGQLDAKGPKPGTPEAAARENRARLRADLGLRRRYNPDAKPLREGSALRGLSSDQRRQLRQELLRSALEAYRLVVDGYPLGDRAQQALLRIGEINGRHLKDPEAADAAYLLLLSKYPGTPEAVAEQCAVGDHCLEEGKLAEAERAARLFLAAFPNHSRAADATLIMAECHRRGKEYVKALDAYNSFLARYPRSPRAAEAREEIEWLKKYRF